MEAELADKNMEVAKLNVTLSHIGAESKGGGEFEEGAAAGDSIVDQSDDGYDSIVESQIAAFENELGDLNAVLAVPMVPLLAPLPNENATTVAGEGTSSLSASSDKEQQEEKQQQEQQQQQQEEEEVPAAVEKIREETERLRSRCHELEGVLDAVEQERAGAAKEHPRHDVLLRDIEQARYARSLAP